MRALVISPHYINARWWKKKKKNLREHLLIHQQNLRAELKWHQWQRARRVEYLKSWSRKGLKSQLGCKGLSYHSKIVSTWHTLDQSWRCQWHNHETDNNNFWLVCGLVFWFIRVDAQVTENFSSVRKIPCFP